MFSFASVEKLKTRAVTVQQQFISDQGLLESRGHEGVSSSRMRQDGEVDPEEEQVEDEGHNDESYYSCEEMFRDSFLYEC